MTTPHNTGAGPANTSVEVPCSLATACERASTERWFHTLVQNNSELILVLDGNGHLLYANPATERTLGYSAAEQAGLDVFELVHPDDRARALDAFTRDLSRPGLQPAAAYRVRTAAGGWRVLEVRATNCLDDPAIGGLVVNARDVTESATLARALRTLGQGNQVLVEASDEASLLADTCRTIVEAGGYLLAWVGMVDNNAGRAVRPVASAGQTEGLGPGSLNGPDDETGCGLVSKAIRTGAVQVLDDLQRSTERTSRNTIALERGFQSSCAMPLCVKGDIVGALSIYAQEPGAFDPAALELLSQLAHNLAYGIERLRDAWALESSEERFRVLAETAPIGIVESLRGELVYANPRAAEICGVSVEALVNGAWTDVLHPDDVAGVVAFFDRARPTGAPAETTFRIRRPDGKVRHVRVCAAPRSQDPDSYRVTTISDTTEEVEAQERLVHQAFYDTLTDLPNRDLFLDRLAQELVPRRGDKPDIAVLCIDLDRFKVVNDSLGHEVGDEVLKKTAARLRRALRVGETVARFGGDEFVLIIRDVHQVVDAVNAAKRLMGIVQSSLRVGGHNLTVTGSIGVVVPACQAMGATVVRDAETAMYRAKEAGRDRYEVFNDDLHHRSVNRLAIESDLRLALKRRQFELYYQGGVALPSGKPIGAEALIRWHHPKRGMVPPLEFIPVAEDSGMINAIGAWVFEQAVAQLASWDAEVNGPRLGVLAVNMSARQLDEPDTSDMIRNVLARHAVDPARIGVELTESAVMTQSASTREALTTLRELGVRVGIDDFGTGYSSLAYLHTLPVTTLKIDRSFVERLGSTDESAPVVQAVIDMGHAMGLKVIAEGVSSERLAAQVAAMGCDVGQGFFLGRPLPAEEFKTWWRETERGALALPSAQ